MGRLALLLMVGGGFLGYFGYSEYRVGAGSSETAVPIELLDLESGVEPPGNHLEIGAHWAIYSTWVGWGELESDQLDYIYYPIISEYHPYNQAWDALLAEYGDSEIPESRYPQLTSLAVLVKTDRYRREGEVPDQWQNDASIAGLLIHDAVHRANVQVDEAKLLQENYPHLSLSNVMILEEGRKPRSTTTAMAMMGGGALLLLGGLGTLGGMRNG